MGKASRDKGKRGELHCRDLMRRVWPGAYRTGDQFRSGVKPCDVEGTPLHVEAKSGAPQSIESVWSALRQAEADRVAAFTPRRPIAIYMRMDREAPIVAMRADEWIELAAAAVLAGWGRK